MAAEKQLEKQGKKQGKLTIFASYFSGAGKSWAMLKAAQVSLVGQARIGAGLVTALVQGEVGAVEAAVDAGSAAAQAIGTVVSCHVIPRPHGAVGETMPDMKYGEGHV